MFTADDGRGLFYLILCLIWHVIKNWIP